jgi:HK97 family phage major capsid protein
MNLQQSIDKNVQQKNVLLSQATNIISRHGLSDPNYKRQYDQLMKSVEELEQDISLQRRTLTGLQSDVQNKPSYEVSTERRAENRAWQKYLKTGDYRSLTTDSSSAGAVVPEDYQRQLYAAASFYGNIAGLVSHKYDDSVRPANWPVIDDTANGFNLIAETASSASTSFDPVFLRDASLNDSLVSRVTASFQLEADSFDFQQFLNTVFAPRLGRSLEKAITVAKDFAGNALPNNPTGGLLANLTTAGTVATSGSAPSYANLVSLYSSIDPSYRLNGKFMAHSTVHDALAGVLDSTGRPLYPINAAGNLVLVKDAELVINQAMPALSATSGATQIAFGDYSKAYAIAYSGLRVKRVTEMPGLTENMLATYLAYFRIGGVSLVTNTAKVLKNA